MRRLITVDDPRVACDTLMWEDGTLLVVLTWLPHKGAAIRTLPLTCCSWVELRGFEPLTPSMRTRCATGLRYSPENLS